MGLAVFLTDENTEGVYRQNDYIRRKSQESGLYKHLICPEGDEWDRLRLQKLMIIDPDSPGRCDMLRPLLEEEKNRIHVVRYGSRCFEAMPEGCSKGTGVERLARYLGTVSYTHLDVYKRQEERRERISGHFLAGQKIYTVNAC